MKKMHVFAAAIGALCLSAGISEAGYEIYDSGVDVCATNNCGSVFVNGSILGRPSAAARWQAAVYANAGECLRIEETASSQDDEIVVVAPNGVVWRDDDSGAGTLPRVAFQTTVRGWYYVTIGNFAGTPGAHNITVGYGRYAAGNANCTTPTTPALASQAEPVKGAATTDAKAPSDP